MKKYESSPPANENHDQSSHYLPKRYYASIQGTKQTKLLKEIVQSPKNINQTAFPKNSSLCSLGIESENKYANELGAISLAVNYCLNTQSKIADTLAEIGQYLKALNEDSTNSNTQKQKQNILSPSASTIFATNRTPIKQEAGGSKKSSLQPILVKIEVLQKEICLKIREFDDRMLGSEGRNGNNVSGISSPLNEFVSGTKSRPSFQKKWTSPPPLKMNSASQKTIGMQPASSQERLHTMPCEFNQKRRETMPDETLNFSRHNFDLQSIENSRLGNLNLSLCVPDSSSKQKATGQRKNVASKLQLNLFDSKNASTQVSNLTSSEKSNSNKRAVAVKLDLQASTKSLHESLPRQMSLKKVGKEKTPQKEGLKKQPTKNKVRDSASLDRKYKSTVKKDFFTARRGTTANIKSERDPGFLSLKTTPREQTFDFGIRKNSTKPDLNIVPPKEIFDEGAPEHTADHTMQKDDSVLTVGENTPTSHELCKSLNLDTERVYETEEIDDLMQNPTQSFLKSTARKEKLIIKTLMKDQYGNEVSSYQKANHGEVYQKKCLINARWWRAWKDFVNFDGEDAGLKGLYPRPGPINNRELIRQDVLLDLGNLTPELELKDNLLEHHDYEAVNKKVYDVLAKWYGFDFEICRMLKPDPFRENKPYLELYPKKKPGAKANQASVDTRNSNSSSTVINSIINSNLSQP